MVTEVVREEAKTQILVAKAAIGMGERLTADTVEWQDWPEGAIRPEYVTIAAMPDAPAELTGAVARFEFFPGEPIREQKLVRTDQGYLSAVLDKGMRGVSVPVTAESSAGGFVVPNDRVDVVLTQSAPMRRYLRSHPRQCPGAGHRQAPGRTWRLRWRRRRGRRRPGPRRRSSTTDTIATLELDPAQAEALINATSLGRLSLVLRSIADFNDNTVARSQSNQPVRLIRFGQEQSVMAGSSGQSVGPAGRRRAR